LETHPLTAWESYYVIVGTSGAALIGMQFVVMTLIAERRNLQAGEAIKAFGSPTVGRTGCGTRSCRRSRTWR